MVWLCIRQLLSQTLQLKKEIEEDLVEGQLQPQGTGRRFVDQFCTVFSYFCFVLCTVLFELVVPNRWLQSIYWLSIIDL